MISKFSHYFRALFVGLLCGLSTSIVFASQELRFEGLARDISSDELLYSERHVVQLDEKGEYLEVLVSYYSPEEKLFARKFLDFRQDPFMPHMRFVDFRENKGLEVTSTEKQIEIVRVGELSTDTDFSNPLVDQGKILSQNNLKPESGILALDGGSERLTVANFEKLSKGSNVEFDFLALSRNRFVGFELERYKTKENTQLIEIAPQSWLIDLLMSPIILEYDKQTQRLMRYRGVTNIAAEDDGKVIKDHFNAEIIYRYEDSTSGFESASAEQASL